MEGCVGSVGCPGPVSPSLPPSLPASADTEIPIKPCLTNEEFSMPDLHQFYIMMDGGIQTQLKNQIHLSDAEEMFYFSFNI